MELSLSVSDQTWRQCPLRKPDIQTQISRISQYVKIQQNIYFVIFYLLYLILDQMNVHLGEVAKDIQAAFGQRDVHGVFGADVDACARFRQHYEVITRNRALIPNRIILYLCVVRNRINRKQKKLHNGTITTKINAQKARKYIKHSYTNMHNIYKQNLTMK